MEAKRFTEGWCGNLMERDHVEDLDLDGRIALRLVFKIWDGDN